MEQYRLKIYNSNLAAKVCGLKIEKIFDKINKIDVEGRLQLIRTLLINQIFLDYAHTRH